MNERNAGPHLSHPSLRHQEGNDRPTVAALVVRREGEAVLEKAQLQAKRAN